MYVVFPGSCSEVSSPTLLKVDGDAVMLTCFCVGHIGILFYVNIVLYCTAVQKVYSHILTLLSI